MAETPRWQITRADLNRQIADHMHGHHLPSDRFKAQRQARIESTVLQGLIMQKLLLERAKELPAQEVESEEDRTIQHLRGQLSDPAYRQMLQAYGMTEGQYRQAIHNDVLIRLLIEKEAVHDTSPTDKEVDAFYAENKERFNTPRSILFSRILISVHPGDSAASKAAKFASIQQASIRIKKGEDFAAVAREVSDDQDSARKGGEMGWSFQGAGDPIFEKAAFALQPGEVSDVLQTREGYEIIKILQSRPASEISEADARATIVDQLRMRSRVAQEQAYDQKLLATSDVIYHIPLVNVPTAARN